MGRNGDSTSNCNSSSCPRRHSVTALFCSICAVVLSSCNYLTTKGEDGWEHYENGGRFDTRSPSVSSDGLRLAFASPWTGHGDIYVVQSGAEAATRLTESNDFESSPMFTPKSDRIIYVRESGGRRHIWIMNTTGDGVAQLTDGNSIDDVLWISSDGRVLIL